MAPVHPILSLNTTFFSKFDSTIFICSKKFVFVTTTFLVSSSDLHRRPPLPPPPHHHRHISANKPLRWRRATRPPRRRRRQRRRQPRRFSKGSEGRHDESRRLIGFPCRVRNSLHGPPDNLGKEAGLQEGREGSIKVRQVKCGWSCPRLSPCAVKASETRA